MMAQGRDTTMLAGPGLMLLSAAIFGYFGFASTWVHSSAITGKFLLFVALLEWTLKGCSIAFVLSAALAFVRPLAGNLLFGVTGLLGAALFVAIAVMDYLDKQHTVLHPLLLLVFAAWNGWASFSGLRTVFIAPAGADAASESGI